MGKYLLTQKHIAQTVICFFILLCSSCAMRQVHMKAMQPALITVPAHVQTVLILDRSQPDTKAKEIIGSILSAGLPAERKAAVQEALNGLQQQMQSSPRFHVVRATEVYKGSNLTSAFPEPLEWSEIEHLCRKYETDAVVALEIFSTKFVVTDGKRVVKKYVEESGTKKEVEVTEYYADGIATADMGFRFYDPVVKTIADQKLFSLNNRWGATGTSPTDAIGLLINKSEAQKRVSYNAGLSYGSRISPLPITITRSFYGKPKKNAAMIIGNRQADTNQWYEAVETWQKGMGTAKTKVAGRLAYNVAIAYEVIGDLDKAIEWAGKSFVEFGDKHAKEYSDELYYRLNQEKILDDQLSNGEE